MNRARLMVAAALLAALFAWAAPARAQVPPEAAPVVELVAPIVSPICGNAVLVVVLAPSLVSGQLGTPLPVEIAPVLGPAVAVCGSVPVPGQRFRCAPDASVRGALDTITGTAAGTPLPSTPASSGPPSARPSSAGPTAGARQHGRSPPKPRHRAHLHGDCRANPAGSRARRRRAGLGGGARRPLRLDDLPALDELPPIGLGIRGRRVRGKLGSGTPGKSPTASSASPTRGLYSVVWCSSSVPISGAC